MADASSVPATARAFNFTDAIGVNTHISWKNAGLAYADAGVTARSVAYLGVAHVRDGIPFGNFTLPEYVALARTGVKFNVVASGPAVDIAGDLSEIGRLAAAVPGSITSIEGVNEFNIQNHVLNGVSSRGNPGWVQTYGPQLHDAVKADPALRNVPVVAASMGGSTAADLRQYGDVGSFVDRSNWHVYHNNGNQPLANMRSGINQARSTAPGDAVVVTEAGYYTAIDAQGWGGGGVSQPVQAILTVNSLLDAFKLGAERTYLYELLDNISNPSSSDLENSFGLFLADGTPKPAAVAVHNLTTLLADPGADAATFAPAALGATVTGLPASGSSLTLQKSDGTFDLVLWDEPKVWDQPSKSAVTPASTAVTVDLGASYATVKVFDPLVGTAPIQTLTNASTVQLSLASHPFIVEVSPARITAGAEALVATAESSAPDVLTLCLSEDAWNGDAQFEVTVDGKTLGAPQMVFASQAAGESQEFTFTGDFGPGEHRFSVRFLNDAYDGTPAMDRNLYLLDVNLNGRDFLASTIAVHGGAEAPEIIVVS